ncbi:hypothetical protein HMPREF9946_02544 [Acetobacteraceae bacterium AT-5844]|nr:hypothetical protein HMPREF9946_02544 [Acetobacteraceae bacterium AT-5844]
MPQDVASRRPLQRSWGSYACSVASTLGRELPEARPELAVRPSVPESLERWPGGFHRPPAVWSKALAMTSAGRGAA